MHRDEAWKKIRDFRLLAAGQKEYLEAVAEDLPAGLPREEMLEHFYKAVARRWPHEAYRQQLLDVLQAFDQLQEELGYAAERTLTVQECFLKIMRLPVPGE